MPGLSLQLWENAARETEMLIIEGRIGGVLAALAIAAAAALMLAGGSADGLSPPIATAMQAPAVEGVGGEPRTGRAAATSEVLPARPAA